MKTVKNIPPWVGDIMLFVTALVWGGGFIGVKKSLETLTPFYMIGARFAVASLLLILLFWKRLKDIKKEEIIEGSVIGIFLFIGFAFQTIAAVHITVGKIAFLTALNVIIVPFLSYVIYRESVKKHNIVASFVAIIGFAFLNFNEGIGLSIGLGEVLAILCAVGFAGHITCVGHYAKKRNVIHLSIVQMIVCCILGFICALIFEKPPIAISQEMLSPILYLGVFSTFVAFLFQTIGQKYTSASRAAIILCMESVFGIVFSVVLLKEVLTIPTIIGAVLILGSVILSEYMHVKIKAQEDTNPEGILKELAN